MILLNHWLLELHPFKNVCGELLSLYFIKPLAKRSTTQMIQDIWWSHLRTLGILPVTLKVHSTYLSCYMEHTLDRSFCCAYWFFGVHILLLLCYCNSGNFGIKLAISNLWNLIWVGMTSSNSLLIMLFGKPFSLRNFFLLKFSGITVVA